MFRRTFTFDGKRYDITAPTELELERKIERRKIELEQNKIRESNLLVKDWTKNWLKTYKEPFVKYDREGRSSALEMYTTMTRLINSYIGSMRIKDVITADLQRIVAEEYKKGRSKSHIDKVILTIRQVFKQARIDRKINENPAEAIQKPKMQQKRRRAVTDKEREIILSVAKTHRHGRWIRSILFLGLRPFETTYVQGKDVDIERRLLHVRGTKSNAAERYVTIPEVIIDDYKGFSDDEYLFTTKNGNPPNKQCRHRWWKAFKRDVDIAMGAKVYRNKVVESVIADDLVAYCLRHTYGTDAQASGIPVDVLAGLMGHEDIQITQTYYIHENYESKQRAREAFEEYYKKKLPEK